MPLLTGPLAVTGERTMITVDAIGDYAALASLFGTAAGTGAISGEMSAEAVLQAIAAGQGVTVGALTAEALLAGLAAGLGGAAGAMTTIPTAPAAFETLDNVYGLLSPHRALDAWSGATVHLNRFTDDEEEEFTPDALTGWLDGEEIADWLGGDIGQIITLYDQTGNSRHIGQTTKANRPTINLNGAHPTINFAKAGSQYFDVSNMGAFAQAVGAASLVAVRRHASAAGATDQNLITVSNNATNVRMAMSLLSTGLFQVGGRRTDGNSYAGTTGIAQNQNWAVQVGRFNYAASDLFHRVGAAEESNTSFQTDGVTSNTAATRTRIGASISSTAAAFFDGEAMLFAFVRDLISDAEEDELVTTLGGFFNGLSLPLDWFASSGCTFPWYALHHKPALYDLDTDTYWYFWEAGGHDRELKCKVYYRATGVWSPEYTIATDLLVDDDHGSPSAVRDPATGHKFVFYKAHNSALKLVRTTTADDPSAWTTLTPPVEHGTYPQAHIIDDVLWMTLRGPDAGGQPQLWLFEAPITAGVPDFSGGGVIMLTFGGGTRCYQGSSLVRGTEIHTVLTQDSDAETGNRINLYYVVLDTTTRTVRNYANDYTEDDADWPVTSMGTNFKIFDHVGGNYGTVPSLVFIGDTPHIGFTDGTDETGFEVKHMTHDGDDWIVSSAVGNAGDRFCAATVYAGPDDTPGMVWPDDPDDDWNRGGNIMRAIRSTGGVWGSPETIRVATDYGLDAPSPIDGGNSDCRFVFCEVHGGAADEAFEDEEQGILKLFAYGDDDYLRWTP